MSLPLPFHSYSLRWPGASSARLVNCYAEPLPKDANRPYALSRSPGIASFVTVGTGPIHGMLASIGFLWVVSGTKLYKVSSGGTVTELGDVGAVTGRVDLDNNTTTVVVVNQPNAYYYDTSSSTFGQITDVDFTARGATDVEFLDNFLIFVEPTSQRFFCADVGSATSFDSLKFASAEAKQDFIHGMIVDHRQVLLFGSGSTEIWELVGGAGFPFARAANGYLEQGIQVSTQSTVAKFDNTVAWLAEDQTVRVLRGTVAERISHGGIEQALSSVTRGSARAFSYAQEGHIFYVLQFPERTFVYDAITKEWHERQTYGFNYWLPWTHVSGFDREFVGDVQSNRIGYLSPTTYTDWGTTQRMSWTYQPVYADGGRAFHDRLEVVCETGVGLTSGQGSDPEIMMEVSDDGGVTYSSLPNRKLGKIGESRNRVFWNQLGSSYHRVYRGSISDPVRSVLKDTQLAVRGGRL